jgi:membrane protein DedA with SNARE-associated domain
MLESFLAKYGYLAVFLGTALEGETVLIMGGFLAHRGYLELIPWLILAGAAGNFVRNQVYFLIGRRYGVRVIAKHPEWKPRLDRVNQWIERYRSYVIIGLRFATGFRTIGGIAIGMLRVPSGRFIVWNGIGALLWGSIIGCLGYLCGRFLEMVLGELKHFEVPILIGFAVCGCLWFWYRRRHLPMTESPNE